MVYKEHEEQRALCHWMHLRGIVYFSIPNGAHTSITMARRLKAEGMQKGIPDLFIPQSDCWGEYKGTFIEMKAPHGAKPREEQLEWHDRLINLGYKVIIAYGWQDAADQLEDLGY